MILSVILDLYTTTPGKRFQGVISIQEDNNINGIQKRVSQTVSRIQLAHVMLFRTAKIWHFSSWIMKNLKVMMDTLTMKTHSLLQCLQVFIWSFNEKGVNLTWIYHFYLGTIPISPLLDPSTKWTMFINFGHNDPNVDISGVDFTSVNAVVVYQDMKWVLMTFFTISI